MQYGFAGGGSQSTQSGNVAGGAIGGGLQTAMLLLALNKGLGGGGGGIGAMDTGIATTPWGG